MATKLWAPRATMLVAAVLMPMAPLGPMAQEIPPESRAPLTLGELLLLLPNQHLAQLLGLCLLPPESSRATTTLHVAP